MNQALQKLLEILKPHTVDFDEGDLTLNLEEFAESDEDYEVLVLSVNVEDDNTLVLSGEWDLRDEEQPNYEDDEYDDEPSCDLYDERFTRMIESLEEHFETITFDVSLATTQLFIEDVTLKLK